MIGGRLELESLWIAPGAVVWVEADLDLRVSELARIEGQLVALDAAPLGVLDAPTIAITSALAIDVVGDIRGGRGLAATSSATVPIAPLSAKRGWRGEGEDLHESTLLL